MLVNNLKKTSFTQFFKGAKFTRVKMENCIFPKIFEQKKAMKEEYLLKKNTKKKYDKKNYTDQL